MFSAAALSLGCAWCWVKSHLSSRNASKWSSQLQASNITSFNITGFRDLTTTRNHCVQTPVFSYNGHDWDLLIYPGGNNQATEGYVSIFLNHRSKGSISVTYGLMILDKFGKKRREFQLSRPRSFQGMTDWGWHNFILRSDILDESKNILDSDGTLKVAVFMKEETPQPDVFVPKNPFQKMVLRELFLVKATADVCFEVSSEEAKKGKKKQAKATKLFHAHFLVLKEGAPMLASLFDLDDSDGKLATATINGIKPAVFHHLLWYVYGGIVPEEDLKTHAKDIIEAADKYAIVNLKLAAEAAYVESTVITAENAVDNLLYADSKNCALLKESVLDFLAENTADAQKISFCDVPGHIINDLLVAFGRSKKSDGSGNDKHKYSTMRVSELRRMLDEKGLDVDGPREAMIEALKADS